MATKRAKIAVGSEIEPLIKVMNYKLKEFGTSFHDSEKAAWSIVHMDRPIGQGSEMGIWCTQAAAAFFGHDVFDRTGTTDMHFSHPWHSGDTMTITGRVSDIRPEGNGQRVTVDMRLENQKGERCGLGICSAIVAKQE